MNSRLSLSSVLACLRAEGLTLSAWSTIFRSAASAPAYCRQSGCLATASKMNSLSDLITELATCRHLASLATAASTTSESALAASEKVENVSRTLFVCNWAMQAARSSSDSCGAENTRCLQVAP